jgi:hypothetical protein
VLRPPPDRLEWLALTCLGISLIGVGLFVAVALIARALLWWALSPLGALCAIGGFYAIGAAMRECHYPNNLRHGPGWPKR